MFALSLVSSTLRLTLSLTATASCQHLNHQFGLSCLLDLPQHCGQEVPSNMPPKKKDPFAFVNGSPKKSAKKPRAKKTPKSGLNYATFYREMYPAVKCSMPFLPKSQLDSAVKKAFADHKREEKLQQSTPVSNSQKRKLAYTQFLQDIRPNGSVADPSEKEPSSPEGEPRNPKEEPSSPMASPTDNKPISPLDSMSDHESSSPMDLPIEDESSSPMDLPNEDLPSSPVARRTRKRLTFSPDHVVFTSKPQAIK